MKILIVDDSMVVRKVIARAVAEFDFESVIEAGNGAQALEIFQKEMPDVVTMDINMPEIDGLMAMRQMLKMKPDVKVIMITSMSGETTAKAAMDQGAAGFLAKPLDSEKFKALMEEFQG